MNKWMIWGRFTTYFWVDTHIPEWIMVMSLCLNGWVGRTPSWNNGLTPIYKKHVLLPAPYSKLWRWKVHEDPNTFMAFFQAITAIAHL